MFSGYVVTSTKFTGPFSRQFKRYEGWTPQGRWITSIQVDPMTNMYLGHSSDFSFPNDLGERVAHEVIISLWLDGNIRLY